MNYIEEYWKVINLLWQTFESIKQRSDTYSIADTHNANQVYHMQDL